MASHHPATPVLLAELRSIGSPQRGYHMAREEEHMYIRIGTIILIILVVLVVLYLL